MAKRQSLRFPLLCEVVLVVSINCHHGETVVLVLLLILNGREDKDIFNGHDIYPSPAAFHMQALSMVLSCRTSRKDLTQGACSVRCGEKGVRGGECLLLAAGPAGVQRRPSLSHPRRRR